MLAAALILLAAGRLRPDLTPDTPSYLVAWSWPQMLGQPRNPLFSWILDVVTLGSGNYAAVPVLQTGLFFFAAFHLFRACRRYGLSRAAALALTLPLVLSNLVILWNNAVHPELAAAGCLLIAIAELPARVAKEWKAWPVARFSLLLGVAYILRPTYLPFIFICPGLFLVLARLRGMPWRCGAAGAVLLAGAAPFLLVSTLRFAALGDFNIVSYGGYQMSGMAGEMLDAEIVDRLPADLQPLGRGILAGRNSLIAAGGALPTPRNSSGQRSYMSVALGYYDLLARNYDYILYNVIGRQRGANESWVDFNRRLQRFAVATVLASPARYGAWLVGAITRAVGRMTVTNAPFMAAILGLLVAYPLWLRRRLIAREEGRTEAGNHAEPRFLDLHALIWIVALYTLGAGALQVLVTFPAARYLDAAGLLLPALPAYALIRLAIAGGHGARGERGEI